MSANNLIDISRKDKAAVLAALYNRSRALGLSFIDYKPGPIPIEEARELLREQTYFYYIKGRVMKVDLGGDTLDPRFYDLDNGEGAAARAIEMVPDCC